MWTCPESSCRSSTCWISSRDQTMDTSPKCRYTRVASNIGTHSQYLHIYHWRYADWRCTDGVAMVRCSFGGRLIFHSICIFIFNFNFNFGLDFNESKWKCNFKRINSKANGMNLSKATGHPPPLAPHLRTGSPNQNERMLLTFGNEPKSMLKSPRAVSATLTQCGWLSSNLPISHALSYLVLITSWHRS